MAHDVFICHSSKDKSVADAVCDILELEGITCWIAPRDVSPLEQWPGAIINAIRSSKIVIFIFSSYANESEHVKNEVINSAIGKKYILTIRIENLDFNPDLQYFLSGLQWIDALNGPVENYRKNIVDSIRQKLKRVKAGLPQELAIRKPAPQKPGWDADKLYIASNRAKFSSLERYDPKTPLEMIKQNLAGDKVLPIMAELSRKNSIGEQIKYAREQRYADVYSDSWAEHELQIIGLHVLSRLHSVNKGLQFSSVYDAGCANCGQYAALMALAKWEDFPLSSNFQYYAQDFNSDWAKNFGISNGRFIVESLPLIDITMNHKCDLICCTHALHYLGGKPLAIYTTLFSFNQLLGLKGYCCITVPEKASLPGLLDLLEKSAKDAGFRIVESGKKRLTHKLTSEPHNITTFFYLIIQKTKHVNEKPWKHLIGASFIELGDREVSSKYGINYVSDIQKNVQKLERELVSILDEKDSQIRLFRYALDRVHDDWKKNVPDVKVCSTKIEQHIKDIHALMTEGNEQKPDDRRYEFQKACAGYFYWLAGFFISFDRGDTDFQEYVDVLKSTLNNNKDIRVDINNLDKEQSARLIKHLFELCQHEKIDLLRAFDSLDHIK